MDQYIKQPVNGARIGAALIDFVILFIFIIISYFLFSYLNVHNVVSSIRDYSSISTTTEVEVTLLNDLEFIQKWGMPRSYFMYFQISIMIFTLVYFIIIPNTSKTGAPTLGKKILGITVVNSLDNSKPSFMQLITRNYYLYSILLVALTAFLVPSFTLFVNIMLVILVIIIFIQILVAGEITVLDGFSQTKVILNSELSNNKFKLRKSKNSVGEWAEIEIEEGSDEAKEDYIDDDEDEWL